MHDRPTLSLSQPSWATVTFERDEEAIARLFLPAQDSFEVHVYEYESLHPGQFTLETHLNYVGSGTKDYAGTVAPFEDQLHVTLELTAGLTDHVSIGFMELNARAPATRSITRAGVSCRISMCLRPGR
jgi:hypothetical protein